MSWQTAHTGLTVLSELEAEETTKAKTIMIDVSVIYNQLYHKQN